MIGFYVRFFDRIKNMFGRSSTYQKSRKKPKPKPSADCNHLIGFGFGFLIGFLIVFFSVYFGCKVISEGTEIQSAMTDDVR